MNIRRLPTISAILFSVTFILTCALYLPVLFHPFVDWDDTMYLTNNPYVTHPENFSFVEMLFTPKLGYPLPLVVSIYRSIYWLFGFNSQFYHLVSILIHAISACLLIAVFMHFLSPTTAFVGALIWAFHPIVVEPVAWATGLKDLLLVTFSLSAFLSLLHGLKNNSSRRFVALMAVSVLFALLSKPTAVSLLVFLVIAPTLLAQKGNPFIKWSYLTTGVGFAFWGMIAAAGVSIQDQVGTLGEYEGLEVYWAKILGALNIHLIHTIFPINLLPAYFGNPTTITPSLLFGTVVLVGAIIGSLYCFRKSNKTPLLFLAWVLVFYAPVSNLAPLGRFTADSYFYAPLIGVVGLGVFSWQHLTHRFVQINAHWVARGIAILILIVLASFTIKQQAIWRDAESLWTPVMKKYPNSTSAAHRYAAGLLHMGKLKEAKIVLESFEQQFFQEGWLSDNYPPLLATLGENEKARHYYVLAFNRRKQGSNILRINFIRFLLNNPDMLDNDTRPYAKLAIPTYANEMLIRTWDITEVTDVLKLAGDSGEFATAEQLAFIAASRSGNPMYQRLGFTACNMQQKTDCNARWKQNAPKID